MQEHKSLHLVDVISGVAIPVLGLLIGLVATFIIALSDASDIAIFLLTLIPGVVGLIFSVLMLIGRAAKKPKFFKVIPIVFNAIMMVVDALVAIFVFFVALMAGLLGGVIAAIATGIGGGGEGGDGSSSGAADDIVKQLMNIFAPVALVFVFLSLFALACLILSIIAAKTENRKVGMVAGELTRYIRVFEAMALAGFVIFNGANSVSFAVPFILQALAIVMCVFPLANMGNIQIAFHKNKYSSFDWIERLFFTLSLFSLVMLMFLPGYLEANNSNTVIYIIGWRAFFVQLLVLVAIALYYVSRLVKKVFFLQPVGALFGIGAFVLTIVSLVGDTAYYFGPYVAVAMILLGVNGLALLAFLILEKTKVIKVQENVVNDELLEEKEEEVADAN